MKTKFEQEDYSLKNLKEVIEKENARKDWTIMDWQKKDPEGLSKVKNIDKPYYDEMYSAYYKK
jgi:hypothetical protein